MFKNNQKVILITFNGTLVPTEKKCQDNENYWLLIGSTGEVIETKNKNGRVLVIFDEEVIKKGLNCHNLIPNSLYILESDLISI